MIKPSALTLSLEDLVLSSIENYNYPCHYMPRDAVERRLQRAPVSVQSDPEFLFRIVQNHLRHAGTDYDDQLEALTPTHPDNCHRCNLGCYGAPEYMDDAGICSCPGCDPNFECDEEEVPQEDVRFVREYIQDEIDCQWPPEDIRATVSELQNQG